MGLFSKLRSKKKKVKHGEKKYEEYESVDVGQKKYTNMRAAPELVLADAPSRPTFGGKGLQGNTTYQLSDEDAGGDGHLEEHQKRTDEGKAGLRPFGIPPEATERVKGKGSGLDDSHGKPPAKAAIDGVTDDALASDLAKQTGAELGSGNAPLGDSESDPVVPPIPDHPPVVVSIMVVLKLLLGGYLGFMALFTAWLRPGFWTLFWSLLIGGAAGLAYSWLFFKARYTKKLLCEGFNVQPGRKGMTELLGQVPSWISFQEKERVQWANVVMQQMWQYYDRAIGEAIKESVEPIMDQYKPPGIVKKIYFKRFSFGDLPLTIDDVWVENEGEKHILLEMSFRLAGNSNIEIAIEMAAGGSSTRLVPKVTDLHVSGTARIILSPLLPEIPGFGAMVFSLKRPPLIHFNLNFGSALGGGASAGLVRMWLDPFLRETLTSLIVWPNRMVFPILPESPANNLEELTVKNTGLLEVKIIEATDLDKQDFIGKSDPLVECWTQKTHVEATKHLKKTLNPEWNAHFHFLVQEPKTQELRLQVYDWDGIHLKEVFSTINLVKGVKESFGAKTFMARTAVPIRPFYDAGGKEVDQWLDLGRNDWSQEEGTGKGHGRIHIRARYTSFEQLYSKPRKASVGAVLVTIKSAKDLPAADNNGLSDPYATITLGSEKRKTTIQYDTLTPTWNEKFEFVKIRVEEVLRINLFDDDPLDPDDPLGLVEVSIADDVVNAPQSTIEKIFFLKDVPKDSKTKEEKRASLTLKVQWVPFESDPEQGQQPAKAGVDGGGMP